MGTVTRFPVEKARKSLRQQEPEPGWKQVRVKKFGNRIATGIWLAGGQRGIPGKSNVDRGGVLGSH